MALPKPPIQILPSGLLGFLGIKNGGQYPQSLSTDLTSDIDILQWYLDANAEDVVTGTTAGALGYTVLLNTGPLVLLDWSVRPSAALAAAVRFRAAFTLDVAATQAVFDRGDLASGIATELPLSNMAGPIFFPRGTSLGVWQETAGGPSYFGHLRFCALPAS